MLQAGARSRTRRALSTTLFGVVALLAGGCSALTAPVVGVDKVDAREVYASLNETVLSSGRLSTVTREALHSLALEAQFETDPDGVLRAMHQVAVDEHDSDLLFALAELSYSVGIARASPDHYLAAAVYAYCFLLGKDASAPPTAFDSRFRWACELYNHGLQFAFVERDVPQLVLENGRRKLPVGSVDITLDRSHLPWPEGRLDTFVPANDYLVHGLSLRRRRPGLGVPVIGVTKKSKTKSDDVAERFVPQTMCVPVTIFLRLNGDIGALEHGISATLEAYSSDQQVSTEIDGRIVPLEADPSTALAYALQRSKIWEFSLNGFLGQGSDQLKSGLAMVRPYQPGRIPVVFVHGTASNPAYWSEMFNTLQGDPVLSEKYQFWFFLYPTGNPVAYSGAMLRDSLREITSALDPDGKDEALQHMVVIGHSQGGLLAHLVVTHSDLSVWTELAGVPIDKFDFSKEQRELLDRLLIFEPLPFVERVVFIATPHRGSFLTKRLLSSLVSSLIELPSDLVGLGGSISKQVDKLPKELRVKRLGNSLDNMDARNPYLKWLQSAPIAPGVVTHSIIAVEDDGPLEECDDGVVAYTSAHIDGVASELVVRSFHSCQDEPDTIREVRRILLEHLHAHQAPQAP